MGRFGGLGQAKVGKSLYYEEGSYVVEILNCLLKKNRKGQERFIIETKVHESSNPKRPVGCQPAQVITMENDMAFPNIKGFIAAVLGVEPDYIPEEEIQDAAWLAEKNLERADEEEKVDAWWEEQAEMVVAGGANGLLLELTCTTITTRNGNPFTLHQWGKVVGEAGAAA